MTTGSVAILSGPPGAGKTTLARMLAAMYERGVHLRTDLFYEAIVSGFVPPWLPESHAQNVACVTAAARAAAAYAAAGYAVVVDGVVLPWAREIHARELGAQGIPWRFVVLLPGVEALVRRGLARTAARKPVLTEDTYRTMHAQFASAFGGDRDVVDTTALDEAESLAAVRTVFEAGQ